jgi:hypothetical protein
MLEATADATRDLMSGHVDARILALLDMLTDRFDIRVTMIKTGHPLGASTPGGRENDHFFYRAFDIDAVDGVPLGEQPDAPSVVAVGELLMALTGDERPARVLGPAAWLAALGPGDRTGFRDDAFATGIHADHLHIGF